VESTTTETPNIARVRALAAPIVADLGLDIYDLEHRGGTLRLTLDTPVGTEGGVTLDKLSLASRLVSKELDAHDPIPSRYTLEVTSPGVERSLRTPAHFQRSLGAEVTVRLQDVEADQRRLRGVISAADDDTVTIDVDGVARTIDYRQIDRAKTIFEWGPAPKPGSVPAPGRAKAAPPPHPTDPHAEPASDTTKEHAS
jgi:ribosome maturation factor RimP